MSLLDVLKSKMYYLIDVDNQKQTNKQKKQQKKTTKGVNKNFVRKLRQEYIYVFLNKKAIIDEMNIIQSKLHEVGTYEVSKISFILF